MNLLTTRWMLCLLPVLLLVVSLRTTAQETDPLCSDLSNEQLLYQTGLARGSTDEPRAARLLGCYLERVPDDPLALAALGDVNLQLGNMDTALQIYNQLLTLEPKNAAALNGRGTVARHNGWDELAFRDFDSAVQADPTFATAYLNRGIAWRTSGNGLAWQAPDDLVNAASDLQRAIDLGYQPLLTPRWNLALVYEASGDDAGLERILYDIIQSEPDYQPAYQKLVTVLQRLDKTSEAQNVLGQLYNRQTQPLSAEAVTAVNRDEVQRQLVRYLPLMLIALFSGGLVGNVLISRWRR